VAAVGAVALIAWFGAWMLRGIADNPSHLIHFNELVFSWAVSQNEEGEI
jgi:hypothetical protein